MKLNKKRVYKQALLFIENHPCISIDDVIDNSELTVEEFNSLFDNESKEVLELNQLIEKCRRQDLLLLRTAWQSSKEPALQIAFYNLMNK